ncbi:MAG: alpha/beta hydrolase [Clostridiales bacterium]|nr:alpha/beta hydrolase [Clostridiales bacterium]
MTTVYIVLIVLLCLLAVALVVLLYQRMCNRLFREIFARKAPIPRVDRSPVKIDQKTVFGRGKNWFYTTRAEYINVRIDSFDGTKLSGYFRPSADRSTRFAIILLHAYDEHPTETAAYARLMMRQLECHVLIAHERAHQMSGGKYCTYGIYESVDVMRWIGFLRRQIGEDVRVFIVGRGIGASAALLAAEQSDFPTDVAGIIADSPLADLNDYVAQQVKEKTGMNLSMIVNSLNKRFTDKLNTGFESGDVVRAASRIRVPVLVISGADDNVTSPDSVRAIYDDLRCQKRLLAVDRATHLMAYDRAPASIEREVRRFVENCVVRLVSIGKM